MPGSKNPQKPTQPSRRLMYWILAVLVAFIVGYLIPWTSGLADRARLAELTEELNAGVERATADSIGALASEAALYVAIGDYANAKERATAFFDGIRELSFADETTAAAVASSGSRRDDVLGLLSQNNDLALYQLLDLYSSFERVALDRNRSFTDPRFR